MKVFSPGKINLALNVGPKRPDGYHRVDSVFHMIELGDTLSFDTSSSLDILCNVDLGISVQDNLVFKAIKAFDERFNTKSNFTITINKQLMAGGGLGGGSSNAAAALYGLCKLHHINLRHPHVQEIASSLGSDVPVFLAPTGASLTGGRGEHIERSLTPATGVPVVIAWPIGAHSNTGEVYRHFDESPTPTKSMLNLCDYLDGLIKKPRSFGEDASLLSLQAHFLAGELYNNLSEAALRVTPEVGDVLLNLLQQPQTLGATVSGSGACSFALCSTHENASALAEQCLAQGFGACATKLRAQGVSKINGVESLYE